MWKAMLDKTDELGKRRGIVGDLLCGSLNEDLKKMKRTKEQSFKRQVEIFQTMMGEVLESVKELTNVSKHLYILYMYILCIKAVIIHIIKVVVITITGLSVVPTNTTN